MDTRGTFIDVVLGDDGRRVTRWRGPTTPDDPARGISRAAAHLSLETSELLREGSA